MKMVITCVYELLITNYQLPITNTCLLESEC